MHTDLTILSFLRGRIYTVKRFLPLALLRLKTCLPVFDSIRTRKPWVLFLLVFVLLVKVFFISKTPISNRVSVNHSRICLSRLNWFGLKAEKVRIRAELFVNKQVLKEKSIKCTHTVQAGEDQMIAVRIYLPEESPSSTGQDGR